ncbi:hypothetical protein D3C83_296730 [compost metagenome]
MLADDGRRLGLAHIPAPGEERRAGRMPLGGERRVGGERRLESACVTPGEQIEEVHRVTFP